MQFNAMRHADGRHANKRRTCCSLRNAKLRASRKKEEESHASCAHARASTSGRSSASRCASPEESLQDGTWVKLICGASFEDVVSIRALSTVYALAGVDCIDCAADPAVVQAVRQGIDAAARMSVLYGRSMPQTWIMISINDGEDPHFRKAVLKSGATCPPGCPRPCESSCPASAFLFADLSSTAGTMVIEEKCYGCGRCIPVCPYGLLEERWYTRSTADVVALLEMVDAIEIHTREGHLEEFKRLWQAMSPALQELKLVAVSTPQQGVDTVAELSKYHECMVPAPRALLWQLDGRPMSGDIGRGTTRAAIRLAEEVVTKRGDLPGYLQLAGGTNAHTHVALAAQGLWRDSNSGPAVHGIAFGGVARKLLSGVLMELEDRSSTSSANIEQHPDLLERGLLLADGLLSPWK